MTTAMIVLLGGRHVGELRQGKGGKLTLTYDSDYRLAADALPLSLSMPLAVAEHDDPVIRAFCQGLLPDNEAVLDRWGREFQVSSGNPFALLSHVGEDCAGAVQFALPDRVEGLLARTGSVAWLTEEGVAERLRALRRDPSAWHLAGTGQFSLAGAQAKTALHHDASTGRWGDPSGAIPTTHILKPAIAGLDDHDLNEHLCLQAARSVGILAASSRVLSFAGERAVVVDRYDRFPGGSGIVRRLHQEDMCQTLGIPPATKYQSEGGPTPEQIIRLMRDTIRPPTVADLDIERFVDALALNWIIAGTDAHAKNFSLLLTADQIRLAPLYDVASSLPYDEMYLPRLRLAMKIGSEYRVEGITGRHWRAFAERNRLDPDRTVERVDRLAERLPAAFRAAADDATVKALDSELPDRLAGRVAEHAEKCRRALEVR
ncbi:type II toxin-antitoxin system HipA family toxin [Actinoplanes sp. TBRC 11911]|uniref:type II toxin-antitoxin system HipA family toxin n=1 Tax=Actinoplanes sp. TBRC 11911 TaxID=2729386 RepID=UPI00145E7E71|nr:type II toxin-antitoxin system HipA family toxin [Actinoplanes sp. TBRC 11911]NMO55050.1 type II toxin-antitoxin system HipA family toxin [Actinoplanes sp. TBRC 11911]